MTLLSVEGLGLRFGAVTALAGVSFTVEAGERVALLGPNGAGKTSVLNCISGVERPTSGRVALAAPAARTLQGLGLVDALDVESNLLLGRHRLMRAGIVGGALRLPSARREEAVHRERCREVAAELDLTDVLSRPAGRLGAGARKRVELGRALAADAGLLLLDEPFAGTSLQEVALMAAAIRRATGRAGGGAGALIVDHDRDAVLALADRVVALDGGRMVLART